MIITVGHAHSGPAYHVANIDQVAESRQRFLWRRAGFAGTRPALAIATVEQACRCVLEAPGIAGGVTSPI